MGFFKTGVVGTVLGNPKLKLYNLYHKENALQGKEFYTFQSLPSFCSKSKKIHPLEKFVQALTSVEQCKTIRLLNR